MLWSHVERVGFSDQSFGHVLCFVKQYGCAIALADGYGFGGGLHGGFGGQDAASEQQDGILGAERAARDPVTDGALIFFACGKMDDYVRGFRARLEWRRYAFTDCSLWSLFKPRTKLNQLRIVLH